MLNPYLHVINLMGLTNESQGSNSALYVLLTVMAANYSSGYVAATHGTPGNYFITQLETSVGDVHAVRKLRTMLQSAGKL